MRFQFLIALVVTLTLGGVFWYETTKYECPAPLHYRVGSIDSSFSITEAEAKTQLLAAEAIWEDRLGRELFVYDEAADFVVDFVYDERQENADLAVSRGDELDSKRAQNEQLFSTIEQLQAEYKALAASFERKRAAYESDLAAYNTKVQQYNDRGGAPPKVFEELEAEKRSLQRQADQLTDSADELNQLATDVNRLQAEGNALVREYNQDVNQYNNQFGYEREFTQGDYQGDRIHIYKFSNDAELVTVLGHEFGHALGIGHVEATSSLMYYLLEDLGDAPVLSVADVLAYQTVCGMNESLEQQIRRFIREFLAKW